MKNNENRKETRKSHFFSRLVFESFDVHLSLIYKKRPEHIANEAKQGEFINNVSNYPKIVRALFKGKWSVLGHFVTQLLEWYK